MLCLGKRAEPARGGRPRTGGPPRRRARARATWRRARAGTPRGPPRPCRAGGRLSSYSRYFMHRHPRQMGRALVPRVDSAPTTGWVPHPGASPMATGTMRHADDQPDHEDGRATVEPFELLTALAAGRGGRSGSGRPARSPSAAEKPAHQRELRGHGIRARPGDASPRDRCPAREPPWPPRDSRQSPEASPPRKPGASHPCKRYIVMYPGGSGSAPPARFRATDRPAPSAATRTRV